MASGTAEPGWTVSPPGGLVLGLFAATVAAAWIATIATSNDLASLLMLQVGGAAPVDRLTFLGLVGVMMTAMMLPAALPMVHAYRGLATLDSDRREGTVRTLLFGSAYFVLWIVFTALALVVLVALGLMGTLAGDGLLVPGLLLIAAGIYQFTSWKTFCLSTCRTPVGFVITNWRSGRKGAARMGLSHGLYCLGCCWVLMVVVFVTGAMSLLWMAGFSGLVLIEKVWSQGETFARAFGVVSIVAGAVVTGWLVLTPGLV